MSQSFTQPATQVSAIFLYEMGWFSTTGSSGILALSFEEYCSALVYWEWYAVNVSLHATKYLYFSIKSTLETKTFGYTKNIWIYSKYFVLYAKCPKLAKSIYSDTNESL